MRDNFPAKVKSLLSGRAGFYCSNPECQQKTDGPALGAIKTLSIGEAAHICAASPGGKRYDAAMSSVQRASYENGIWLCRNCAAMIDRDESYYTVELLNDWKQQAEQRARKELERQGRREIDNLSDDEKITLFFMKKKQRIMVTEAELKEWLLSEEIHDYHFENARLLLSAIEDKDKIQLWIDQFRKLLKEYEDEYCVETIIQHKRLASYTLREKWEELTDSEKLLFAYVKEERCVHLGAGWKGDEEIERIKAWEAKNSLDGTLSNCYGNALGKMIDLDLVYESDWTLYGNTKKYTLYKSAFEYIISEELEKQLLDIKIDHMEPPF